jgi:hypothetical protein
MRINELILANKYFKMKNLILIISVFCLSQTSLAQTVTQQYYVTKSYQKLNEQGTFYDAIAKAKAFFLTAPLDKTFEVILSVPSSNISLDTSLPYFAYVVNPPLGKCKLRIKSLDPNLKHTLTIDSVANQFASNDCSFGLSLFNYENSNAYGPLNSETFHVEFSDVVVKLVLKTNIVASNASNFHFLSTKGYYLGAKIIFINSNVINDVTINPTLRWHVRCSDLQLQNTYTSGFDEIYLAQFEMPCLYPLTNIDDPGGVYSRISKIINSEIRCNYLHLYHDNVEIKNNGIYTSKITGLNGRTIDFSSNTVILKVLTNANPYNGSMVEFYCDIKKNATTLLFDSPYGFTKMINKPYNSLLKYNYNNSFYIVNASGNSKPNYFFDLKSADHQRTLKVYGQKFPGSFGSESSPDIYSSPSDSLIIRNNEIIGGFKDYPIITYKLVGSNNKINGIVLDGILDKLEVNANYDFSTTANEDAYRTVFNKPYVNQPTVLDSIGTIYTDVYKSNSNGDLFEWLAADTLKGIDLPLSGILNKSLKLGKKIKLKDGQRIAITYTVLPMSSKKIFAIEQHYGTFTPSYYTFQQDSCNLCIPQFAMEQGKKYVISAWVKEKGAAATVLNYADSVHVRFFSTAVNGTQTQMSINKFVPTGTFVEGWQKVEGEFVVPTVPNGQTPVQPIGMNIILKTSSKDAYFDDIRVHTYDGTMQSFVYNPKTLRLEAVLDERNYSTIYEHNEEGQLIRVKKETEKGIMTIKESRMNTRKNP